MVSRTQTETEVKYYIKWMPLLYSVQKNWFIVHVYMYYYIFMTNNNKKKTWIPNSKEYNHHWFFLHKLPLYKSPC